MYGFNVFYSYIGLDRCIIMYVCINMVENWINGCTKWSI